jgi:signal peptidase I
MLGRKMSEEKDPNPMKTKSFVPLSKKSIILSIIVFFVSICPASAEDSKKMADGFFYNNQYRKAVSYYLRILEKDNNNPEILYRIGLSYYLLRLHEKAVEYWSASKKINPGIFKGRIFIVPAGSMKPTLIVGDNIIVDQEYYEHKEICRGDVIIFLYPENPNISYVKRVIGLPGDKVLIRNKEVWINERKFIDINAIHIDTKNLDAKTAPRDNYGPMTVPERKYFVLGDNRDNSFDSRFFGCVDKDSIIGKALVIYFSAPDRYSMDNAKPERSGLIIK